MATPDELKQKIETLKAAGLPYDDELKQLQQLQGEAPQATQAPPQPAPAPQATPAFEEGEEVEYVDAVNPDTLGGSDFYPPSSAGVWKSVLTGIETSFDESKNWRVFVVETNDDRLEKQGRGTLICDLDKVAWKLTRTLENLDIVYSVNGGSVSFKARTPMLCVSEWEAVTTRGGKEELKVQNLYAPGKAPEKVM